MNVLIYIIITICLSPERVGGARYGVTVAAPSCHRLASVDEPVGEKVLSDALISHTVGPLPLWVCSVVE